MTLEQIKLQIKYHTKEMDKHDRALKELFILREIEREIEIENGQISIDESLLK